MIKSFRKPTFSLFIFFVLGFLLSSVALGQTENLGVVSYSPPKGWTRSAKENIVIFSEIDKAKGNFCFITLYGATPSTGNPQTDFAREWKNLVVKPFGAEASPKSETVPDSGWTGVAGGAAIDFQGNKAFAFLTVISGFGRTVSVLGILNDDSYLTPLQAFVEGMDVDKTVAANPVPQREEPGPAPTVTTSTMNAGSLVTEFERNEVRAYQVWVGKRVRINGVVNLIDVKSDGRIAVTFKSTASAYGNARCYFDKSQSPRVAALTANQEAAVEGTVRGWEGGYSGAKVFVLLEDCIVP